MKGSEWMRQFIAVTEDIQALQALQALQRNAGKHTRSGGRYDGGQRADAQRERLIELGAIRVGLEADRRRDTCDQALRELARLTLSRTTVRRVTPPSPRTPGQQPQRTPQQAAQARPSQASRADDDVSLYVTRRRGR